MAFRLLFVSILSFKIQIANSDAEKTHDKRKVPPDKTYIDCISRALLALRALYLHNMKEKNNNS